MDKYANDLIPTTHWGVWRNTPFGKIMNDLETQYGSHVKQNPADRTWYISKRAGAGHDGDVEEDGQQSRQPALLDDAAGREKTKSKSEAKNKKPTTYFVL